MAERQQIEIDYCPTCRGIWLDRGELDNIIDRANEELRETDHASHTIDEPNRVSHSRSRDDRYGHPKYIYRKRKSMLGELFDIFD